MEEMVEGDQKKLNVLMQVYFQPVYDFVAKVDQSILNNIKHFALRKKIFELIGMLGVYSNKDVY